MDSSYERGQDTVALLRVCVRCKVDQLAEFLHFCSNAGLGELVSVAATCVGYGFFSSGASVPSAPGVVQKSAQRSGEEENAGPRSVVGSGEETRSRRAGVPGSARRGADVRLRRRALGIVCG